MKIIEKVEIKNFRSFGNRKKEKTIIVKLSDLNVFSGANDSGKSNILRALNLFFNEHTNLGNFFDFKTDFFSREHRDESDVNEELVTIKVHFLVPRDKKNEKIESAQPLPEKFWVSRKWKKNSKYSVSDQDDGLTTAFKKEKGVAWEHFIDGDGKIKGNVRANLTRKLTNFLHSVQYHYVPAIKDRSYFSHLYGEMQQSLLKGNKSDINRKKELFQKSIQDDTKTLMEDFESVVNDNKLNISAVFELPDLINLFQTLKVQTGTVNLISRGDGIQAKLIPEILNFISLKERSFTTRNVHSGEKAKKYFIWGFEEPENSYEYKNAQILADKFKNIFSKNAQIFLTTHSFNFLSCSGENVATYRVWKDERIESSRITKIKKNQSGEYSFDGDDFKSNRARLNEELGVFALNSDLEKVFHETEQLKLGLEKKLSALDKSENILFVEDSYFQIYKIAWLKTHAVQCDINDFEDLFSEKTNFKIDGCQGTGGVAGLLRSKSLLLLEKRQVIGLFDFDKEGQENFHNLKKDKVWGDVQGAKNDCHYKKRSDHESFHALLLPVPARLDKFADLAHENFASYIEVENLLPQKFLTDKEYVDEKMIVGETYFKFKSSKKDNAWKSLFELDSDSFNDFIPLFSRIDELFGLNAEGLDVVGLPVVSED